MKSNFLLNKSLINVADELSDSEIGKLFRGILKYVNYGDSELDGYLKIVFIQIKELIDTNEESYQKRCEINKKNGSKGGAPKGNKNAEKNKNNRTVEKTTQNNPKQHECHNHIHIHNHIHKKIIDYLNKKTNSKFKYNTKTTESKINARLNEGYNLDDFIAVIDKKYDEWIGTEFEKHLCPETLFGTKFEKYLNQKVSKKNINEFTTKWLDKDVNSTVPTNDEINTMSELLGEFK